MWEKKKEVAKLLQSHCKKKKEKLSSSCNLNERLEEKNFQALEISMRKK
jgi:hypothetical protein